MLSGDPNTRRSVTKSSVAEKFGLPKDIYLKLLLHCDIVLQEISLRNLPMLSIYSLCFRLSQYLGHDPSLPENQVRRRLWSCRSKEHHWQTHVHKEHMNQIECICRATKLARQNLALRVHVATHPSCLVGECGRFRPAPPTFTCL